MAKSTGTGFKHSIAAYDQLVREIGAGRFVPLYLLMGEENYFIDRLADLLADKLLDETARAFSQIVVYGKDTDEGAIINLARQMPMMGNRQVVIVREAQQLRRIEALSSYTGAPSPSTVLILCMKGKNLDKRTQLYKHIAASGTVFESVRPRDYEIGPWLEEFIRSQGYTIDRKALEIMTDHLGTDVSRISNELTKLLTSLPQGTTRITAQDIEEHIGISKDFNNFELTRAISERNAGKAMLIAEHFARNPKDNPIVVTIGTLFSHFQRIFILNYERWLAARGQAMPPDQELSRMLKLPNPFFLNEYKQAAAAYPNKKVFIILGLLREYDLKSKGMDSGSASQGELLRELLLKIFLL